MTAVKPDEHETKNTLAPIDSGLGDREKEAHDGPSDEEGAKDEWEELADKYDQPGKKVKDYLEDQQELGTREPPIINAPPEISKEQWEKTPSHTHHIVRVADAVWQPEQ